MKFLMQRAKWGIYRLLSYVHIPHIRLRDTVAGIGGAGGGAGGLAFLRNSGGGEWAKYRLAGLNS